MPDYKTVVNGEEWFCRVRSIARQQGMSVEDAEDCAITFVERHWFLRGEKTIPSGGWLLRCARNYVLDCLRAQNRLRRHETAWPLTQAEEDSGSDGTPRLWEPADSAGECPLGMLLREECWAHLIVALDRLEPEPRRLLVRYHLGGESLATLAEASGRSSEAVRKSLQRAAKQVRALILRQGCSEEDFRRSFVPPAP